MNISPQSWRTLNFSAIRDCSWLKSPPGLPSTWFGRTSGYPPARVCPAAGSSRALRSFGSWRRRRVFRSADPGFQMVWRFFSGRNVSGNASAGQVLLSDFMEMGCRFRGNLPSFTGWYGREPRQRSLHNLTCGLYFCFGSDGHGLETLMKTLRPALSVLKGFPKDVLPPGTLALLDSSPSARRGTTF